MGKVDNERPSAYSYRGALSPLDGQLVERVRPPSDRDPGANDRSAPGKGAAARAGAGPAGHPAGDRQRDLETFQREPLSDWGQRLLQNLPRGMSLDFTARHYPHVINRLALAWDNARDLDVVVEDLLLDDRAQRQGFPLQVLNELTEARRARIAMLTPHRPHRF